MIENRLDINYFEELEIDDYFRLSKKLLDRIIEEKQVEDYYSMYLELIPLMIREEIAWKSFKDFFSENRPTEKKEKPVETTKTNEEILKEINNIQFE